MSLDVIETPTIVRIVGDPIFSLYYVRGAFLFMIFAAMV